MLFRAEPTLNTAFRRKETLTVSIAGHVLLLLAVLLFPEFFRSVPKRIIHIAGQEYDLSKNQVTELALAPPVTPPPVPKTAPLVQPPVPRDLPQPTPPPPPPQPPPR